MSLKGLTVICKNPFGIVEVEYLPTTDFNMNTFDLRSDDGVFTGVLGNNRAFYKAPLAKIQKSLDGSIEETPQGDVLKYGVQGAILEDTASVANELRNMKQYRYILKIKDDEGRVRILGTIENPCRFNFSFIKSDSGNSYNISWSTTTPSQILFA